jgi:hypothetical protein
MMPAVRERRVTGGGLPNDIAIDGDHDFPIPFSLYRAGRKASGGMTIERRGWRDDREPSGTLRRIPFL